MPVNHHAVKNAIKTRSASKLIDLLESIRKSDREVALFNILYNDMWFTKCFSLFKDILAEIECHKYYMIERYSRRTGVLFKGSSSFHADAKKFNDEIINTSCPWVTEIAEIVRQDIKNPATDNKVILGYITKCAKSNFGASQFAQSNCMSEEQTKKLSGISEGGIVRFKDAVCILKNYLRV
jgi:hypothetical protein